MTDEVDVCDICGEPIVWNEQAVYCAIGSPKRPHLGPSLGEHRHYKCHAATYGEYKSPRQAREELDASFARFKDALDKVKGHISEIERSQPDSPSPRGGGARPVKRGGY